MVTASIVIYKTLQEQIEDVLKSIEANPVLEKLYIIDNFPTEKNESLFKNCKLSNIIEYIPHDNTGYGSSHNIALHAAIEIGSDYHVVLNPDIYFDKDVLKELLFYMELNKDVGYILPKVTYPNGELQYLCKLLPTPLDLIFRRFLPKTKWIININNRYELRSSGYDKIINPPCLS